MDNVIETRMHREGNKTAIGTFFADGSLKVIYNPDCRFMASDVKIVHYPASDFGSIAAARRMLDEVVESTSAGSFDMFFSK